MDARQIELSGALVAGGTVPSGPAVPASTEAQCRNARCTRLRFGPTYTDEVARLQRPGGSVATIAGRSEAGRE